MFKPNKPSKSDLIAAQNKTIPDVIAPGLQVLFCGINPGLYSGATGHHFARPGNRFWPVLHQAGFTEEQLTPAEEMQLLGKGYGITNFVQRATAKADELSPEELVKGRKRLSKKIKRYQPAFVAILGISAYRIAFEQPKATLGPQPEPFAGASVWVLPNPSGLNAHYQIPALVAQFQALREAASRS